MTAECRVTLSRGSCANIDTACLRRYCHPISVDPPCLRCPFCAMTTVSSHRGVRWLALLGYAIVVTLFGNGVVLCQGADGHIAIELYHDSCCPGGDASMPANPGSVASGNCCTDSVISSDQVVEGRDRPVSDQSPAVAPLLPLIVAATDLFSTRSFHITDHPPDTLSVVALSLRSVRLLV